MVAWLNRTNAHRCSCIKQITCLQREEAADISYDFIDAEQHVTRKALLYSFSVLIQTEMQVLNV